MFAFVDILKSHEFKHGNKLIWSVLVFVVPPFGALSYYGFGKIRTDK
ncbi:PLD nuclease N-terminal domain-containing protein [Pediococcus damnosus]